MHNTSAVSMVTLGVRPTVSSNIWRVNPLQNAPGNAPTWPNLIAALIAGEDLSQASTQWAMNTIMAGNATDVQIAGFLVALMAKGGIYRAPVVAA